MLPQNRVIRRKELFQRVAMLRFDNSYKNG